MNFDDIFQIKQKFNQIYDEFKFQIDIAGQIKYREFEITQVKTRDIDIFKNLYAYLIDSLEIIYNNVINSINNFINRKEALFLSENSLSLEKLAVHEACFFMANNDLNFEYTDRNQLGLFIKFDWCLDQNEYNFLRRYYGRIKNEKYSEFYYNKEIVFLLIGIRIFNDQNSAYPNIFEFKKSEIIDYSNNLKEFKLSNFEDNQRYYLIKEDTFSCLNGLKSLELNFGFDQIIEFEKGCLGQVSSTLDHLDLSFNRIKDITSFNFRKLNSLKRLVLKFTNLKFDNAHLFDGLNSLQVIELKNNLIPAISQNMLQFIKNLRYLDLSDCDIEVIEDHSFLNLEFLKYLNLSDNLFENISTNTFKGLDNLLELYLCNNCLRQIEDKSFSHFKHLKVLDITNNKIKQLKFFYEQYRKGGDKNFDRLGLVNNKVIKANF